MAAPLEKQGASPSSVTERNSAASSPIPVASPPAPEPFSPNAAPPEEIPRPPEAIPRPAATASAASELPLAPQPPGPVPPAEAAPRSLPRPGGAGFGPETLRQRFRQFRYHDAAGPREAFRQLRELSRQWLRPDIRTKEQIVEMLVQEQLLAILPEAARDRRRGGRSDVRITG